MRDIGAALRADGRLGRVQHVRRVREVLRKGAEGTGASEGADWTRRGGAQQAERKCEEQGQADHDGLAHGRRTLRATPYVCQAATAKLYFH